MDQLEESGASKHLRSATFECSLFGTGIVKGPFAVDKEYANWSDEGEYSPTIKTVPQVKHVSCWDLYPDPDASSMDDATILLRDTNYLEHNYENLKIVPISVRKLLIVA